MEEYYNELPFYDDKKIESIEKIAVMLAKYLLFENTLKPFLDVNIKRAKHTNLRPNTFKKNI